MNVPYALTATAAETTSDGRIWVLGGDFDTLGSSQFPLTLPTITLLLKVSFEPAECGAVHRLRIELWDQDGTVIQSPFTTEFTPQRNVQFPTRPAGSVIALNMQGLSFPNPGDYAFHVLVDDHQMARVPLYVTQQSEPPQQ